MIAGSWGEVAQIHKYFLRFDRCRSGNCQSFKVKGERTLKNLEHLRNLENLKDQKNLRDLENLKYQNN